MSSDISQSFTDVTDALSLERKAMAHARRDAEKRLFAVVMGSSLPRWCRPSGEWDVRTEVLADGPLTAALWQGADPNNHLAHDLLTDAVSDYVTKVAEQIRDGIVADIQAYIPEFDPDDSANAYGLSALSNSEHDTLVLQASDSTDAELDLLEKEVDAATSVNGLAAGGKTVSATRASVIDTFNVQTAYITDRADALRFTDKATAEVQKATRKLRESWTGKARDLYKDKKYTDLTKEHKNIDIDRSSIENELQSYFDHHAHGASQSDTVKPDRVALKLAPHLEEGKAGYKQVQNMDMFSLSRGNEMWAIIPELVRVGHDVDPITCMHWKPSNRATAYPKAIRKYRADQAAALAKRLLSLCSAGLKTKLLAEHKFGVNKERFKAEREDGVQLYWVMLMLFHPLSREYRRTLKREIYNMPGKFSSGDPQVTVGLLQEKLQEAMDMEIRLAWDQLGVPVIDTLSQRDPLFTVELAEFRDKPTDPDDSGVIFEHMLSHISTVIETLNTAQKDWHSRRAKAAQKDDQPDPALKALEDKYNKLQQGFKALQAKGNPNPNQGKGKQGKGAKKAFLPAGNGKVPEGHCQAIGCGAKIDKWHKTQRNWKICGTCLLKVRKTDKPIKLVSGQTWGNTHHAKSLIGMMKSHDVEGLDDSVDKKSAKVARKRSRESDPESPGGQEGDALSDSDASGDEGPPESHVEAQEREFSSATERIFAGLLGDQDDAKGGKANKSVSSKAKKPKVRIDPACH